MVLESKGEKMFKMVLQLLKSLSASSVITVDQIRRVQNHVVVTAQTYFVSGVLGFIDAVLQCPPPIGL